MLPTRNKTPGSGGLPVSGGSWARPLNCLAEAGQNPYPHASCLVFPVEQKAPSIFNKVLNRGFAGPDP